MFPPQEPGSKLSSGDLFSPPEKSLIEGSYFTKFRYGSTDHGVTAGSNTLKELYIYWKVVPGTKSSSGYFWLETQLMLHRGTVTKCIVQPLESCTLIYFYSCNKCLGYRACPGILVHIREACTQTLAGTVPTMRSLRMLQSSERKKKIPAVETKPTGLEVRVSVMLNTFWRAGCVDTSGS